MELREIEKFAFCGNVEKATLFSKKSHPILKHDLSYTPFLIARMRADRAFEDIAWERLPIKVVLGSLLSF